MLQKWQVSDPSEDSGSEETLWECKSANSSGPQDEERKHVDGSGGILFLFCFVFILLLFILFFIFLGHTTRRVGS